MCVNNKSKNNELIPLHITSCVCSEVDENTVIGRYFSGEKLDKLLKKNAIWFSNSNSFVDANERQIPPNYFAKWESNQSEFYKKVSDFKKKMIHAYISCWTICEYENYALWKIYDEKSNGCLIVTTIKKLKEQLNKQVPDTFVFYKVEYINENDKVPINLPIVFFDLRSQPSSIRGAEMFKIAPYEYEKEVRVVFYSEFKSKGKSIKINLNELIDYVVISPFATEKTTEKIKEKLERKFLDIEIKKSIINEKKGNKTCHD